MNDLSFDSATSSAHPTLPSKGKKGPVIVTQIFDLQGGSEEVEEEFFQAAPGTVATVPYISNDQSVPEEGFLQFPGTEMALAG